MDAGKLAASANLILGASFTSATLVLLSYLSERCRRSLLVVERCAA